MSGPVVGQGAEQGLEKGILGLLGVAIVELVRVLAESSPQFVVQIHLSVNHSTSLCGNSQQRIHYPPVSLKGDYSSHLESPVATTVRIVGKVKWVLKRL